MEVHAKLRAVVIDVQVGRCDVPAGGRFLETQPSPRVHGPRSLKLVGEGNTNVPPVVMGEVQVIGPAGVLYPLGDPDERGPVDACPSLAFHCGHPWPDDRTRAHAHHVEGWSVDEHSANYRARADERPSVVQNLWRTGIT